jgi:AcrR family transcriptional regulator
MSTTPRRNPARQTSRRTPKKREPLGREAWLSAARQALIEEGTAGVEINKLAKRLRVSRGGFYWFFKDRAQLLDQLLQYWVDTGTTLFERILEGRQHNGLAEYRALIEMWVNEKEYDPKWDGAIRDWARTSPVVLKAVQSVDRKRVAILEKLFQDMGYKGTEAHIRGRITYYHQVGYYALGIHESLEQRLALLPYYEKVLTGLEP